MSASTSRALPGGVIAGGSGPSQRPDERRRRPAGGARLLHLERAGERACRSRSSTAPAPASSPPTARAGGTSAAWSGTRASGTATRACARRWPRRPGAACWSRPTPAFPAKLRAAELLTEVTPPRAGEDVLLPVGRGGERERGQDRAARDRAEEDRRAHAQLPRRHAGDAVAVGRSAPRTVRAGPARRRAHGATRTASAVRSARSRRSCAHECAQDLETVLLREGPGDGRRRDHGGRRRRQRRVRRRRAGYWKKIRAICDRHGVLLIADEVLSGFGRTGRWFAVDHDGVTPDLLTMAKGITGRLRAGRRGHRHRPDRPPLRRARAGVRPDQLRAPAGVRGDRRRHRDATATRGWSSARRLRARACAAALRRFRRASAPTSARCAASACSWAFEFCVPGTRDPRSRSVTMAKVAAALRRNHLHMHKRDNLVYFAPPLVITDAELDEAVAAVGRGLRRGDAHELHLAADREGLPAGRERAVRPAPRRHVDHVGRLRPVRQRRGAASTRSRAAGSRT